MTCRMFCIVIALMVLSISAILVANPSILGEFSSALNGVPIEVTISSQEIGAITTMRTEDLQEDWADYAEQFVRFIGIVTSIERRGSKKVGLTVDADDLSRLSVYPLDAPNLPMIYQERHVYEFTGFLINNTTGSGAPSLAVYAFEIRHHGESESLREERHEAGIASIPVSD